MLYLHHAIYEGDSPTPILYHVFPGETREAAERILQIHASWDEFLHAAITSGTFQGMKLRTSTHWTEGP